MRDRQKQSLSLDELREQGLVVEGLDCMGTERVTVLEESKKKNVPVQTVSLHEPYLGNDGKTYWTASTVMKPSTQK